MKMMMIEAPEECGACPCEYLRESGRHWCLVWCCPVDPSTRPQWCIDKDVEVEDEK